MSADPSAVARPSAGRALALLSAIAVAIAGYIAIGSILGITSLFAGYFFLLYWTGVKHADPREFGPTLLGALGGLVPAYLLHTAPAMFGTIGLIAALLLVAATIYIQIRDLCPLVINLSFMLFLTLGTVPPVAKEADSPGMVLAILLSAGYFGGLLFLVTWFGRRRAVAVGPA